MPDREISPHNFNSKHYDRYKFSLKRIELISFSNLFVLEVVQKYKHCQLWVLRENSPVTVLHVPIFSCYRCLHDFVQTVEGGIEKLKLAAETDSSGL